MCSKGGGTPPVPSAASTTFNSTTAPAASVSPQYTDFLNRANTLSNTPFNPAQLGTVAPMNAEQTAAGEQMFNLGMGAQATGNRVSDIGYAAGTWDPSQVQAIMSPFVQNVVGSTQDWFNNQNSIQGNDLLSQAIKSGNAFGGDRAGVAEGVLAGQQQLAQAPVIAGLYQSGYTQALDEYNKLKALGLQGAQTALAGQQFGLQGAGAALGWGGLQQQQAQKEADVAQQNAMMQSAYPFQTLNWYGSILGGIGPLLGQTAFGSNNPPEQSGLGSALGIGSAAVGLGTAALGLGGGNTPAASSTTDAGRGASGGAVERLPRIRRKRGGLVPVLVRHNGGIVAGLAYGGPTEYDEDTSGGDDQGEARGSKQRDYVDTPTEATTPRDTQGARQISVPNIYGQLKLPARQLPQPILPQTGGTTQQPQKSETEQILGFATKALPLATSLFALSDPKTKTDVQRVGKTDDGKPLYGFRYKGDPKTYPKVVGPMALPPRAPKRLQDGGGGDPDVQVLSDAGPDPVLGGQQFARDYGGRTTWFNPRNEQGGYTYRDDSGQNWTDTGAQALREGKHASGLPSTTPGFATPGSADLRNWFEVTGPDGKKTYAQKTDIGPPGVVDLNAPLAAQMYGRPGAIPSGKTQVRDLGPNQPAGAGGTPWSDPSKGNTGVTELPSGQQPSTPAWQVPGARQGQEPAAAGPAQERGDPRYGTGPVGIKIPGVPAATFAQRLAQNPFWQFGTALMAKPGIKGRELSAVGGAAQSMSAQQVAERNRVLEDKPKLIHTDQGIMAHFADGTIIPTGLKSEASAQQEFARKTQKPFAVERDTPGPFGSTTKSKDYYSYDEHGNVVPWQPGQSPAQAAPSGKQQVITPDQEPSLPPPQAPQQAPQRQPAPPTSAPQQPQPQLRQTEAQPAEPQAQPEAKPPGWAKDPTTGVVRGPDGATYDSSGKQLSPATAQPPTPQIAGQQPAQPAQQQAAAGPTETLKRVEDQWAKGAIKPGGALTNPAALNRNDAALVDSQGRPLSPDDQRIIKGIADYSLDPNKVFAGKNANLRLPAMNKVMEYDPSYNQGQYAQRNAARKAFEVNGVEARNIQSQDMAVQHADRAMRNIDALNHSRVPWWNEFVAKRGEQTGLTGDPYQKAVGRLQTDVSAVSNELMKVFRGGTGAPSEKEAKRIADELSVYSNPEVLKTRLREGVELLYGKVNATAYRYNDAMGPAYARPTESWFSPEGRAAVQRVMQQQ